MKRIMFIGPPLIGHLNPAISLASELAARGHDVAWIGDAYLLASLGSKSPVLCDNALTGLVPDTARRPRELRGPDAIKVLWQLCIELARKMYPVVRHHLASFEPDLVLCDQQALGGSLAAREAGIPWLTLATTSGELYTDAQSYPGFYRWMTSRLASLKDELDLSDTSDPRFSPYGTLMFSCSALTGDLPGELKVLLAGGSVKYRQDSGDFPWERLDDRRKILVSLGTVNDAASHQFLDVAWAACHERRESVQTVLVDPARCLDKHSMEDIIIVPSVPQLAMLDHVDAVVCHAGQNTVSEALMRGLPLVVAPIRDDQPAIATQVVDAGAGIRVRFGRPNKAALGAAIDAVLGDSRYRAAAQRIRPFMMNGTERAASAVDLFLQCGSLPLDQSP